MALNNIAGAGKHAVEPKDLDLDGFLCGPDGIRPSVVSDGSTITGTGTPSNPLVAAQLTIAPLDACAAGGNVYAPYMGEISRTGTTLNVKLKPEHTTARAGAGASEFMNTSASMVGKMMTGDVTLVVNNPSDCRDAIIHGDYNFEFTTNDSNSQGSFTAVTGFEVSVDGGPHLMTFEDILNWFHQYGVGTQIYISNQKSGHKTLYNTVPAGGTKTFRMRSYWDVTTANADVTWIGVNHGMDVAIHTV